MKIRNIERRDDVLVGTIIRDVLTEFGANRPGFAWQDPELDHMSEAYEFDDRVYKVAQADVGVVGVGGIGPFECDEYPFCCELQKMYFLPSARGKGWGRQLIAALLNEARAMGYQYCYLESLSSMKQALALYEKQGFKKLGRPLGDSGHNACDEWWLLKL